MLPLMVLGLQPWNRTLALLRTQVCLLHVAKPWKLEVHTELAISMLLPTAVPTLMRVCLSTFLRCQTMEATTMWKYMMATLLRVRVWVGSMAMRLLCCTRRPIRSRFSSAAMLQIMVRGAQVFLLFVPKY